MANAEPSGLSLSVNGRADGSLEAAYVQISRRPVVRSDEAIPSALIIDYDGAGQVVGVELLAPIHIADIEKLAKRLEASQRPAFLRFVHESSPPGLVAY